MWGESMRLFEAFWVTTFGLLSMMILALISLEQYSRFVRQKQLRTFQVCGSSLFHWFLLLFFSFFWHLGSNLICLGIFESILMSEHAKERRKLA